MTAYLVWLRPSKQIRAPLYSIKQKRQRRWIVIKYGAIYVLAIAAIAALIAIRECPSVRFICSIDSCPAYSSRLPPRTARELRYLHEGLSRCGRLCSCNPLSSPSDIL